MIKCKGGCRMEQSKLLKTFYDKYGSSEQDVRFFYAPGRVNLIGEHTDYNGGYVFPAALTFGTTMLIRRRNDRQLHFASTNFDLSRTVNMDNIQYDSEDDWVNYPKAMLHHLQQKGRTFHGYDVLFHGEIPNGAGLSSSAAIEIVTGYGFERMEGREVNLVQLSQIAQEAENQFIGVNCGIMDQFTIAMGKRDHAIQLKCDTLEYKHVPFQAKGYKLVIGNTNKRRGLVDSAYNERRAQCNEAVRMLKDKFSDLQYLGELTGEQFESASHLITDETVRRRAEHVIFENQRVMKSVDALQNGDLERFGRYMNESHASLRDLYEVSCRELDVMVETAQSIEGVLGSRMTGAGFGGCTVSLVKEEVVEQFLEQVGRIYQEQTSLQAAFYVANIGDGVKELEGETQ